MDETKKIKILRERAKEFQKSEVVYKPIGKILNVVTFLIGSELYGVESKYVTEVLNVNEIVNLPCTPDFVLGIVNIRGNVLSVLDLKQFLISKPGVVINELNNLLLVGNENIEFCILVDNIAGNIEIDSGLLQEEIASITEIHPRYIMGVTNERLVILNIEEILSDNTIVIDESV
jgi:purine-binding chemotaxis protein CheW